MELESKSYSVGGQILELESMSYGVGVTELCSWNPKFMELESESYGAEV